MAGAPILCSILLLQVIASAAGGRLLQQTSPQAGALPLSQVELSLSDSYAQLSAKLAYLRTLAAGGSALPTTGVRNFAATTVRIGGTNAPLGGFTVDLKVGTPPVSIPVVVDTFTSITWVQGPDCAPCPGSPPCAEATQIIALNGGQLTCPYSGPLYYPSLSSSAITSFDCATTCASDSGSSFNVGCLNVLGGGPTACQYFSAIGGVGLSAGSLVRDAVSLGSVATLSGSTVFVGTSILEPGKKLNGAGGVAAFSPVVKHSLPFQLRDAGAITTPTFAICLASGGSNAGSLFVGGVPTQPNSNAPYPLTFAARQTGLNMDVDDDLWNVVRPTDVLVNGIPVTGASAALAAELSNAFYALDSGTRFTLLPTAVYNPLFNRLRQFSGCPNVFRNTVGNGVDPIQTHDFIDLTTCTPPLSASPSAEELGARFPPITIVLPGGTRLTATAKAYAKTGNFGPNGELALDTGLVSAAGTGFPNDPSRVIGTNFLADNLVVFDVEQNRFGFAPVDCNTLLPLTKTNIPPVTPAPTTPAPTPPAPTTPAPTTPAPTTPAPTTPAPTTPAPTTPAPTTPAPTTPAPTTPAPTTPAPTTPAPTTAAPVTPAPSTPAPTTGIFPAGGSCDAYSAFPNQCFNNVGSQFTCCPVGVSCASPPTSTPACVGFDSSSGGPPLITSAPVTASPTTAAPVTAAPTTAAPVTSAPTTAAPVTSAPTTAAPVTPSPTTPSSSGTTCDPFSALPNQCFNADGSSFICCSGSCPSVPGPVAVCG